MGDRKIDNLFRRFRDRGDVDALGQAFDLAAPELLRVARHLCRSETEAEDAVQASFLTVLERAGAFDEERRLLPWMLGILANHARELYRGSARVPDAERLPERRVADPAEEAGEREFAGAVERAVEDVPASYREVVHLHLAGGLSSVEIAAATGLSPGNARVRLHRGLERLRKLLPVGFAAGAAGGSASAGVAARGLAAVRAEVLAGAATLPSTSSVLVPTSILGGFLVSQRLVLVSLAAALLLVGGAWIARDMGVFGTPTTQENPSEPIAMEIPEPTGRVAEPGPAAEVESTAPERRSLDASASSTVRFSGRVTDLYQPGTMIAGATVWTTPIGETGRVRRDETDERGDFSFEAPPEEESTIFIEAEGYAPFRAPTSVQAIRRYRESHGRQVLDDGRRISIGIIELVAGVRVRGKVRFADGRPAVGAELYLFWHGQYVEALLPTVEGSVGTTGVGGRIELDGRIPIQTRAGEGSSLLVAIAEDRMGWAPFAALKGREAIEGLEIVIRDGKPLRVQVTDEADRPIAGARITCERVDAGLVTPFRRDRSWHHSAMPAAVERFFVGETGADGEVLFPQLPLSRRDGAEEAPQPRYEVFADADGYAGESRHIMLTASSGGPTAKLHLRLAEPDLQWLTGRVVDAAGVPVVAARVELEPTGRSARTDGAGRWELEHPIGLSVDAQLRLIATAEGFVSWERGVERPLPTTPRIELDDLILGRPTTISGRVVDPAGRAVEGAGIWFLGSREGGRHGYPSTRSGPDGSFIGEDVPEGEWELLVWDVLGGKIGDRRLIHQPQLAAPVFASGGDEGVLLVLVDDRRVGGNLVAELIDETSGAPLDALFAGVRPLDPEPGQFVPQARISAGRVTAEGLATGRYQLWAQIQDHAVTMTTFVIEAEGAEVHLRVQVGEPGRLRGTIVPAENRDLSSAWVTAAFLTEHGPIDRNGLHPNLFAQLSPNPADESGHFLLEDLAPGRWRIEARWEDEISERVEVEVVARQESEIELILRPAAKLVLAFGDWPADGLAELCLRRDGEPPARYGFFFIEGLPREHELVLRPGPIEYEVTLSEHEDAEAITGTLELKPGKWSRIECEW